jgi:hypothetical protein
MLNIYKNPYLISNYKGIDWAIYNNYLKNINSFYLSDNLSLISIKKNQYYKIYNKDYIHILEGDVLIDYNKRIYSYFLYDNIYENRDLYKKTVLCKGLDNYNTFLYYNSKRNSK